MNRKFTQNLLVLSIALALANFVTIFGHPVDHDNEEDSEPNSQNVDKVTRNYVHKLVKDEEHLSSMREFAVEWAHNNALIFRTKKNPTRSDVSVFAPVSLFPSPFPRHPFEHALSIQKALNELYFRVGTDFDFLERAYSDLVKTDEHFRDTMQLLKKVHEEGIKQPITVVFQRADYMLNVVGGQTEEEPTYEIKQLEVNCGSVAGTSLDRRATQLNHLMLKKAGFHAAPEDLPENWPDRAQIESIKMAWKAYDNPDAVVLLTISPISQTAFDARFFETELDRLSDGRIKMVRSSMGDCARRCKLDENFVLSLDGREVAVVYSRYSVLGKADPKSMALILDARFTIERSRAIKIPSAFIAFSCSKKVQQLLAEPGQLEHFFPKESDAEIVNDIRKTFAGMWSLENIDEKTEERIKDAIKHPEGYVLKSNLECGGNNYFGDKIPQKLQEIKQDERPFHVLMQRLQPMSIENIMVQPDKVSKIDTMASELGVYGVLMGNMRTGEVNHNVQQGHLLKTKLATSDEGGISAGFAVHDSPILF
ncbi:hypothetical protein niasHS_009304 [Heterodera schachtii]|uniref:Glutathione synthetase n=1 Tax=Heterodera schachtii TaxID=97005 RepID=A0ABD2JBL7_HETSC